MIDMRCHLPPPDEDERHLLLETTAALVITAIRSDPSPSPALGSLGAESCDGCFVSLRDGPRLRSCCGIIGGPLRLDQALARAAQRAACEDSRFPPISEAECPRLSLEIHLLHAWETCAAPAEQRDTVIRIGRDGLHLQRDHRAGLLLPAVAVEQGWDAPAFLLHCCRKAGLEDDAWRDPACRLDLFQAHHLTAALGSLLPS